MQALPKELFKLVSSHASFVDVMSFRRCCKDLHLMPMPIFSDRFATKFFSLYGLPPQTSIFSEFSSLEEYEYEKEAIMNIFVEYTGYTIDTINRDNPELQARMFRLRCGLIHELHECNVTVAGSFVLDVMFDTDLHNDIDIYEETDRKGVERYKFIFKASHSKFSQFLYCCGFSGKETFPEKPGVDPTGIFDSNKEALKSRHSIQIIPVPMNVQKMISASFDLDICKSCFDGKILRVRDWNKLIHRYDYMKCNTKYFMNFYDGNMVSSPKIKVEVRMEKYRQRGFNIQLHPKIDEICEELVRTCRDNRDGYQDSCRMQLVKRGEINLEKWYLE